VLLSGHTDVVPAGSGWATDPYELTEVDGQLRARGSADMKGFLAAALVLMEATELDALRAPVHLGLSYDEEVGCVGVHGLLDALAEDGSCAPDVVVVGEPTSMRLCNAHAGKVGHHLEVVAAAGHSSRAGIQPSAIHEAAALAVRIHGLNDPSHGISANVGTLHGGVAVNVLAPTCTMEFEVRHTADTDPDAVLADVLAEVAAVNARLVAVGGHATSLAYIRYPALDTDPALAPVVALGKLVDRGAPGPVGFGTEAGLYADRLGVPAVILGPGDIADAHRPDEFVDPAQLDRCSDVLRRTVDRFCTESEEA
jgi:acetylornithine deacetylase